MIASEPRPAALAASEPDCFLFSQYLEAVASAPGSVALRTLVGRVLEPEPTPYLDMLHADIQNQGGSEAAFRASLDEMLASRVTESPLVLVSAENRVAALSGLLRWVYPPSMGRLAEPGRLADILAQDGANDFSFLVLDEGRGQNRRQETQYTACCLAYINKSEAHPDGPQVLYVDDLAVTPEGQSKQVGIRVFREILSRAVQYEVPAIELHARHSTSYRAFRGGPATDRLLAGTGFAMEDHGLITTFGEGNDTEYFNLIRMARVS